MFEEFNSVKEELGVTIGGVMALLGPAFKMYVASVNRRFAELKAEIEKNEGESDRRTHKIYDKLEGIKDELHEVKGDQKMILNHLKNGFKH